MSRVGRVGRVCTPPIASAALREQEGRRSGDPEPPRPKHVAPRTLDSGVCLIRRLLGHMLCCRCSWCRMPQPVAFNHCSPEPDTVASLSWCSGQLQNTLPVRPLFWGIAKRVRRHSIVPTLFAPFQPSQRSGLHYVLYQSLTYARAVEICRLMGFISDSSASSSRRMVRLPALPCRAPAFSGRSRFGEVDDSHSHFGDDDDVQTMAVAVTTKVKTMMARANVISGGVEPCIEGRVHREVSLRGNTGLHGPGPRPSQDLCGAARISPLPRLSPPTCSTRPRSRRSGHCSFCTDSCRKLRPESRRGSRGIDLDAIRRLSRQGLVCDHCASPPSPRLPPLRLLLK